MCDSVTMAMKLMRKAVSLKISAFQITRVVDTDFICHVARSVAPGYVDCVPSGLRRRNFEFQTV